MMRSIKNKNKGGLKNEDERQQILLFCPIIVALRIGGCWALSDILFTQRNNSFTDQVLLPSSSDHYYHQYLTPSQSEHLLYYTFTDLIHPVLQICYALLFVLALPY